MKVVKEWVFPTIIYLFDDVLKSEYIDNIKQNIIEKTEEKRNNWQSHPKLHTEKTYKSLADKVLESSKYILNDLKYEYERFEISGMWANVSKPGEMHRPHTHSNNFLSGVYYVDIDPNDGANIQFFDPRPQADVLRPKQLEFTKENASLWYPYSKTNRMVLFPSWLQHYVPINISKTNRISISFNIMIKGQIGRPENFQSAKF